MSVKYSLCEMRHGISLAHQNNQKYGEAYRKISAQVEDLAIQMVNNKQINFDDMGKALRVRVDHKTTIKYPF